MFICKYCNKECKNDNSYRNHIRLCVNRPDYDSSKYKCKFCSKESPTKYGNTRHENHCKNNPNRKINKPSWSKGLTKETSEILRIKAEKASNRVKNGNPIGAFGRKGIDNYSCRPEVRAKISATMKGNHNNNPEVTGRGKKGWYKGIHCSSTYELAFLIYCLDHNINIKRYNSFYEYYYNNELRRYYPDFIINNTIVEIKGYHTPQVDAKTKAVKDRPIKVLYKHDLTEVFDYIFQNYGKCVDKNIHELYENMGE